MLLTCRLVFSTQSPCPPPFTPPPQVLLLSACKRGDLDALLGLVDSGTAVNVVDEVRVGPSTTAEVAETAGVS